MPPVPETGACLTAQHPDMAASARRQERCCHQRSVAASVEDDEGPGLRAGPAPRPAVGAAAALAPPV